MAKKVGILVVHGIGEQTPGFSEQFIEELTILLNMHEDVDVISKEVCWQTALQGEETDLLTKLGGLKWMKLRGMFINYAADAVAYQPTGVTDSNYAAIHGVFDVAMRRMWKETEYGDIPLVIVSHSLGTVVSTNFLWDCLNEDSSGRQSFLPSEVSEILAEDRLKLFVTMGSPLAVWSLRYEDGGKPLNLPEGSKWLNIYSEYDVIGYPLNSINSYYGDNSNIEDLVVNVGNPITRFTPLSHVEYMEDYKVLLRISKEILSFLR